MLRISKLADYGTVIMNYLALHPEGVFSAAQIAQHTHVTAPTVSKLLKLLLEAGLVYSVRGAEGGYRLSSPAEEISLIQVISAIDGSPNLTECCTPSSLCAQEAVCGVKSNWQAINHFIMNLLEGLSIADMARPLSLSAWMSRHKALKYAE